MFPAMVSLYVLAFCRIAIGLLFAVSSISKMLNIAQFRQTIWNFHILPGKFSGIAAWLFLCCEVAVVVLVAVGGFFLVPGFFLAFFLLLLFCIALMSVVARKIRTSCNCFGVSAKPVSLFDVWRNLGFLLCALVGVAAQVWTKENRGSFSPVEWILTGLGAVVFVVIWIQLAEIVQLFRQS